MRHYRLVLIALAVVLLTGITAAAATPRQTAVYPPLTEVNNREILVMLDDNTSRSASQVLGSRGVSSIRRLQLTYGNYEIVQVPPELDYHEVLAELINDPAVKMAGPNVIKHVSETVLNDPLLLNGASNVTEALTDPYVLNNQWGLLQTGVLDVWDTTTGLPSVIVAVIDTGINLEHEDLANRLWTNQFEIPDNEIDDDENGFVDDVHGYDFQHWTIAGGGGDSDPTDPTISEMSHGNATCSIVGAEGNNELGIAGTAGGNSPSLGVRIMPLRVGTDTNISVEAEIGALDYATAHKADIISMSFGGASGGTPEEDAINRAWNAGVYVVAAAGNVGAGNKDSEQNPLVDLPAGFANCVAVGATTIFSSQTVTGTTNVISETLAGYSKTGVEVEISAPGTHIMAAANDSNSYSDIVPWQFTGTSAATPLVAGIAALVLSADIVINGSATLNNVSLRANLNNNSVDLGAPGRDSSYGFGRIDAFSSLQAMQPGIQGDTNNNGVVDADDLQAIKDLYGVLSSDDAYVEQVDANSDGVIDELDLFIVARHFGESNEQE